MGELCPGAVLEPAAVPPPLDLFPWSPPIEPGAHRPAPPELPDHEDLSRTGSEWAVPRRRAGAGGRAPAEISWSSNPPPSPSPSPCPQPPPSRTSVRASGSSAARRSLPRPRAAGGGLCSPPRDLQPVHPSSPRLPASGRGLRTDRRDAAPGAPALSRTPCRRGPTKSVHRGGQRCRLCPVWRRAGAGGRAPAEIPWSLESTSAPQPIALPSTTPSSNGGGELYSPRGISESIPEPQPTSLPRPPPVNQLRFANSGRRRGPRILRRPSQWVRSRICRRRRWR